MNVDRLYDTVKLLLALDEQIGLQGMLQQIAEELATLAASPGDTTMQSTLASHLTDLVRGADAMQRTLVPAEFTALAELHGDHFFDSRLSKGVVDAVSGNTMTVA